ncbi:hypothetical protein L484_013263 [Morus notabilis]|uniref:Uncharacterized protein n=1 Tax=Morus notabilis TaxID=981085 RepID=W9SER9_9ROSA|nr:hypothetical protein L484_013263 [Morus notabilis]
MRDMERKFMPKERTKMERKFTYEEKAKAKHLDCRHNNRMEIGQDSSCCCKTAGFLCSACLLCVSCPLAILSCLIKLPCEVGWRAAKRAGKWVCCRSEKRILAEYSSFSDIDSDSLPTAKVEKHWGSRNLDELG